MEKNLQEGTKEYIAAHEEIVERVKANQPEDEYLYDLSELFKIFGDSTRIRILSGFPCRTALVMDSCRTR